MSYKLNLITDHISNKLFILENNKTALLEAGALVVLVDALKCTDPDMKEVTQRYVAVAICDLIQGNGTHLIMELPIETNLIMRWNRHT